MENFWNFVGTNLDTLFLIFVNIMVLIFVVLAFKGAVEDFFIRKSLYNLKYDRLFALTATIGFVLVLGVAKYTGLELTQSLMIGLIVNLLLMLAITLEFLSSKATVFKTFKFATLTIWIVGNVYFALIFCKESSDLIKLVM
ncbi:hypothetical protein COF68_06270 [Bacillus toyonensis]|uniref:hypothetical protein n=1 Tax=Bacillus toyonensis TaxID=155322 RepID=UPI000BFDB767|nr:hypothetical protein [Bacillus toyonensis]PHE64439.1 hypothetical protein COF68_06270 [Bacillus toyonensis]